VDGIAHHRIVVGKRMRDRLEVPADRAREALHHYNQAIERLKSGDWAGFGTELDAMRRLLEDMIKQSGGH